MEISIFIIYILVYLNFSLLYKLRSIGVGGQLSIVSRVFSGER